MFFDKKVDTVNENDFKNTKKSKKILVRPRVISDFFLYAISNPRNEIASLLSGSLQGEYLLISDVHSCKRSKSSATTVEIDAQDMSEISDSLDKGSFVVGWAHSHPRFGTFMSGHDLRVQKDFQNLFSDSVALVLDPFTWGNIEFCFYREVGGKYEKIEYAFLVREENEAP